MNQTKIFRGGENMSESELLPLSELPAGSLAIVMRIEGHPELKKKVLEMGLVPGTPLVVQRKAPLNDPISVAFRGYELSLRIYEAETVMVKKVSCGGCNGECNKCWGCH